MVAFDLSLFGQNFQATLFSDRRVIPTTTDIRGHGDLDKELRPVIAQPAGPGISQYRVSFDLPDARIWDLDTPWLYQLQVKLLDDAGIVRDARSSQFGMREFRQDEECTPKGKFTLNGREIRLRGANTMGFEQVSVMRRDWDRLIDDILLAKLCNMNFLRLTQRPVQREVYEFCDRLGLMTQTDLPLFGCLRRNQLVEAVRQAEEMERLVRPHACNIMVSYINEPFPNGIGRPHRNLTRPELEDFFEMASRAVRMSNPERVIKYVDGDYDPPAGGLPDNHCYCGWYIGHAIDLGRINRGDWLPIKPGWHFGCGEFGAEGLDSVGVMEKYYPTDWLPARDRAANRAVAARKDTLQPDQPLPIPLVPAPNHARKLGGGQPDASGLGDAADDRGVPPLERHEHLCDPSVHRRLARGLDENHHGCGSRAQEGLFRLSRRPDPAHGLAARRPARLVLRRDGRVRSVGLQRHPRCAARSATALPTGGERPGHPIRRVAGRDPDLWRAAAGLSPAALAGRQ